MVITVAEMDAAGFVINPVDEHRPYADCLEHRRKPLGRDRRATAVGLSKQTQSPG
jgi:hypothetical protein